MSIIEVKKVGKLRSSLKNMQNMFSESVEISVAIGVTLNYFNRNNGVFDSANRKIGTFQLC